MPQSLLKLAGLDWEISDFRSVPCRGRRQHHLAVTITANAMTRDFDRQVVEVQVRAAILNRFTRLVAPRRWQWPDSV
jgi:hypothetical protein